MLMTSSENSIPFRKSRFNFRSIELRDTKPKTIKVRLSLPGYLYCFECTMTGRQFFTYGEFQTAIALDHGVIPYVAEIDQARGTHKRSQLWRSFISSHLSELA